MKFCLLTVAGKDPGRDGAEKAEFAFFLLAADDLNDPERRFGLSAEDFTLLNPNTRTCPIFRSRADAELTRKLYLAAPVLDNETTGVNPWGVSFNAMFHMTNDSGLFRTKEQLEQQGLRLQGNRFELGEQVWLPLYEGRMIHHYDHRPVSVGISDQNQFRSGVSIETSLEQHIDPSFCTLPRYWVNQNHVVDVERPYSEWLYAFKDITSPTNERTMIGTVIPLVAVGNSVPVMRFNEDIPVIKTLCLIANLATYVLDFLARQKLGGVHVNFFILQQFPVIPPNSYSKEIMEYIVPKVVELVDTAWDLQKFANSVWQSANLQLREKICKQWQENKETTDGGHSEAKYPEWILERGPQSFPYPPFKWETHRRSLLRADLDAFFAHLYGLNRNELIFILDSFTGSCRNDEARYGEYRTKRLCLEAYDRLAGSDLIPPEARALQQELVLGERASVPAAKPAARAVEPVRVAAPPQPRPAPVKPAPAPVQPAPAPQAEPPAQPALDAFGLYKCQTCGKRVMGFDKQNHTRDEHKGIDPGYQKIR